MANTFFNATNELIIASSMICYFIVGVGILLLLLRIMFEKF